MWWWALLKQKTESKSSGRNRRLLLWSLSLLLALGAVGPVLYLVNVVTGSTLSVMDRLRQLPGRLPRLSLPKSLPALPDMLPDFSTTPAEDPPTLAPAVLRFLMTHPEFGPGWNPRPPRTWFGRERQIADSSQGPLVFYIEQDEVVAVRSLDDEARLWSKRDDPTAAIPNPFMLPRAPVPPTTSVGPYASQGAPLTPLNPGLYPGASAAARANNRLVTQPPSAPSYAQTLYPRPPGVPAYSLIEVVQLYRERGGRYGAVLVPTFNKKTPVAQRELLIKYVMQVEGFTEASLYCSADAYQADLSERFARAHPRARRCSLGGIFLDLGVRWY